jgi:uncharacterized protein YggU (UPF0235/DUF167 family)
MRFLVKVKTNTKKEKVQRLEAGSWLLSVKARATEGRANAAVVDLLSRYLEIAKGRITITRGHKSRNKVIEVETRPAFK